MGNSLFFIFILILWAADDYKNMSVHVYLLLLGCLMGIGMIVFTHNGENLSLIDLAPAVILALTGVCGIHIGGADIIAAALGGVLCGYVVTARALLIGMIAFVVVKKEGKGAFLPYYLVGQIIATVIGR